MATEKDIEYSYRCKVCGEKIPIDEDFNIETPNHILPLCVDCCGEIEEEICDIVNRSAVKFAKRGKHDE